MSMVKRFFEDISEEMGLDGEITDAVMAEGERRSRTRGTMSRKCEDCGELIPAERLEALPDTTQCVKCSAKNPKPVYHDPDELCARASDAARNGFARSD